MSAREPTKRRLLTTQRGEAGRAVKRVSSTSADSVGAVADLSPKEIEELEEDLRSIDEAQQDALVTGGRHYLRASHWAVRVPVGDEQGRAQQ